VSVCVHTYIAQDLFGGRALGAPTRLALALPETPKFYVWDPLVRLVEKHVEHALRTPSEHIL
jgi:hypothetical protein